MDFYVVLGVPRTATVMDIKRAYRKLARRFHPDINPGDQVAALRFKEITEAYETLSDPERRRRYDVLGYQPEAADASTGFEGFDFSASVHMVQQGTFGDLFAEVFTRERERARHARGADLHATLMLPFDEALRGTERRFTVTRQARCETCAGAGTLRGPGSACTQCHGTGQLRAARGHMVFSARVPAVPAARASSAWSRAARAAAPGCTRAPRRSRFGCRPGRRMARGCGSPTSGTSGRNGGQPGDLYVTLQVSPDARFRREGDDLHVAAAAGGARSRARRADRDRDARTAGARCACRRARSRGSGFGCAAAARRRCRTATGRSRDRDAHHAAAAARRAIERAVAGVRRNQRQRRTCGPRPRLILHAGTRGSM